MPVDQWGGQAVFTVIVGLASVGLLIFPLDLRWRSLVAASVVALLWFEAPTVGNHMLIAALISAVALIARPWSPGWFRRAAPGMRAVSLISYSFAAFAKLNSGFFDPLESCARHFANQTLGFYQLPEIPARSPGAWLVIVASAAVELSVPMMLLIRPLRRIGVLVAMTFHLVLALDRLQHFYDFTLVLLPLFLLFTPPGTLTRFVGKLGGPTDPSAGRWVVPLVAMVFAFALPAPPAFKGMAVIGSWILWVMLLVQIVRALVSTRWSSPSLSWRGLIPMAPILALALLNGLAPYLELKTATGYNMYSNLVTSGGETNHFLVPATGGLREEGGDLVVIVETDDEDLAEYVDSGFAIPFVNLTDYLADHPETSLAYERNGERFVIDRAGDHPELTEGLPHLIEKLAFFRAVPVGETAECQNGWLPAR